jgi:hypothetical protein
VSPTARAERRGRLSKLTEPASVNFAIESSGTCSVTVAGAQLRRVSSKFGLTGVAVPRTVRPSQVPEDRSRGVRLSAVQESPETPARWFRPGRVRRENRRDD